MAGLADGLCKAAVGAESFYLVEGKLRTGSDDEVVIFDGRVVVELEAVAFRMQAFNALSVELDAVLSHRIGEVDLDLPGFAPAHG